VSRVSAPVSSTQVCSSTGSTTPTEAQLQATNPQNLAHALADSPAGQLAWIGQLLADTVDPDVVLTNATIYWLTNTAASSARFYYEDRHSEHATEPTTVPIGLAAFAYDFTPLRRFAERDHSNIVHWNEYVRGGHWSAHDAPICWSPTSKSSFAASADEGSGLGRGFGIQQPLGRAACGNTCGQVTEDGDAGVHRSEAIDRVRRRDPLRQGRTSRGASRNREAVEAGHQRH
jgi:hypothetical protein